MAAQRTAKQQEESRIRQQYCDSARSNLKFMEDSPRIATYDANGERSFLDDDARRQRSKEARKAVSQYCD